MKDNNSNNKLEKGDHYYIQTKIFSPITILFQENFKKKCPEKHLKIQTKCALPPGHPIILLKSSQFNIAAVSVKRSIR